MVERQLIYLKRLHCQLRLRFTNPQLPTARLRSVPPRPVPGKTIRDSWAFHSVGDFKIQRLIAAGTGGLVVLQNLEPVSLMNSINISYTLYNIFGLK